jgi:hypothetical protein
MSIVALLFLVLITFALLSTVFWILTLVDCATNEPSEGNEKIIWILVIIFTHALGALLYRLVRRPERLRLYGK